MDRTLTAEPSVNQPKSITQPDSTEIKAINRGALLRLAIDRSRVKHAAVAAAIAVQPPYLVLMLKGERPVSERHIEALPREVARELARVWAESFGFLVVAPLSASDAQDALVVGLVSLLRSNSERMGLLERVALGTL